MLNIYIPKEPQLKDYGISEKEIPDIEAADALARRLLLPEDGGALPDDLRVLRAFPAQVR